MMMQPPSPSARNDTKFPADQGAVSKARHPGALGDNFGSFANEEKARKDAIQMAHTWYWSIRDLNRQEDLPETLRASGKPLVPTMELSDGRKNNPGLKWLDAALKELTGIDEEVAEDSLPQINPGTKDKARKIIFALIEQPISPTIYPTMDGEIAIYFKPLDVTSSVLILVGNDGQAACFSHIDGKNRRARYEDSSDLPDEFVMAQLRALQEQTLPKDV